MTATSAAKDKPLHLEKPSRKRPVLLTILAIAVLVGGWFGWQELTFALSHESTDDAQVEGRLNPVLPRVSGTVAELLVQDNQRVAAGDPLLRLDTRDYDVKVASAEAALAQSKADLAAKETLVVVVKANIDADAVSLRKAQRDLARDTDLYKSGAISDRTIEDTRSDAEKAEAQHAALLKQAAAAAAQVDLARASIAVRQADLDAVQLQRSYTTVIAPVAGQVSSRNVEVGQFVQAGQPLLAIANDEDVWITANFKETQIADMRPGQEVEIEVDAYPGIDFKGRVDSMSAATGATFALLPPDNATGNFVKVTQRVPVKIVVEGPADPEHPLRPGLSVNVSVAVKAARHS